MAIRDPATMTELQRCIEGMTILEAYDSAAHIVGHSKAIHVILRYDGPVPCGAAVDRLLALGWQIERPSGPSSPRHWMLP